MQKTKAARKARNNKKIKIIQQELAREESNSNIKDKNTARLRRRKFSLRGKLAVLAY